MNNLEKENSKLKNSKNYNAPLTVRTSNIKSYNLNNTSYDYQKERTKVYERIGRTLRGGSPLLPTPTPLSEA